MEKEIRKYLQFSRNLKYFDILNVCLSITKKLNKPVSNLQQHLDVPQLVWNGGGGSLGCSVLLGSAISGSASSSDEENWPLMAPRGSLQNRAAAKTSTFSAIFRRFPLNVLSPGKVISPSVWTIMAAVFILFLFVLLGLSNIVSVSVLHKGFGRQPTRSRRLQKTFLFLS